MVSPEASPVARVGGLADAVAALAKTLARLGHKVTVVMPRYHSAEAGGLMLARRITPLRLPIGPGGALTEATLFDGRLGPGVDLVLVDVPGLYDRPSQQDALASHANARGIYGDGLADYADNARRFAVLSRAAAEIALKRAASGTPFDVVHAHDWAAALVPYFLRGRGMRTVLTVHDAAQQGLMSKADALEGGLAEEDFHPSFAEFYGEVSSLKVGVLSADVVTTVSPSYARELCTPAGGHGLDGVFASLGTRFYGITSGIDYALWSPATDPFLPSRFDAEDAGNKGRCKAAVCQELELSIDPAEPLLVALGRIDASKGSDLLADALPLLAKRRCQLVIAGAGDNDLTARLADGVRGHATMRVIPPPPDVLRHRLVAAADAVLVPSRTEPCGSLQLEAQRYGAAPVVRAVGGLCDTVVDCDAALESGTGFVFDELSPVGLVGAVDRALAAMGTPRWGVLRRRMMRLDVSWERPARRYARLYQTR